MTTFVQDFYQLLLKQQKALKKYDMSENKKSTTGPISVDDAVRLPDPLIIPDYVYSEINARLSDTAWTAHEVLYGRALHMQLPGTLKCNVVDIQYLAREYAVVGWDFTEVLWDLLPRMLKCTVRPQAKHQEKLLVGRS